MYTYIVRNSSSSIRRSEREGGREGRGGGKRKTSKLFVVLGPFVKGPRETGRARTAPEEEATTPEDEDCEADRDCEQYTDQYPYEDHRVFFRPRVIQIQTT